MLNINTKTKIFRQLLSAAYVKKRILDFEPLCGALPVVENMTEDFTAMLLGLFETYRGITGDKNIDLVGFTHLLNRLAVHCLLKNRPREDT